MKKQTDTKPAAAAASSPDEPRNVVVTVLENRTLIRGAICAAGRCSFGLTLTEAKALEALGKVRIDGLDS